jgi:SAM-dependent methyltransferase
VSQQDYVWGTDQSEQQRLLDQVALYRTEASWLLDQLPVGTGARAIDLGCGPLGILDLLADKVGPQGEVVGLEFEERFVRMAQGLLADKGIENVEVIGGDATATGLPGSSFQIAHERLLLIVVPKAERVIEEMVRLVEPGGVVVLEDVDLCSWVCEPPHQAWTELYSTFGTLYGLDGKDLNVGRRLPGLLRSAGLENVEFKAHSRLNRPGDFHQQQLLHFIKLFRARIIDLGLMGETQLSGLYAQLADHLADPGTMVISPMLIQAWGYKKQ